MWLEILACTPLLCLAYLFIQKDKEPLLGVYAQKGKWFRLKRFVFMIMLWLRKRKYKKSQAASKEDGTGYGMKSFSAKTDMERPQKLPRDPYALDAAYFNGMDKKGNCLILRLGRRHNRETEIWLTIHVDGLGYYQYPDHPDTRVYNVNPNEWNAGGLKFECLEPMRRWKVSFNGLLRKGLHNKWTQEKGELVHVRFSFVWDAFTEVFDFDTDLDPGSIADAIAREKWTKEFWDRLKSRHQTHYEQGGMLRGVLKVEGEDDRTMTLRGFRDHSYGVRDWRSFHRYVVHFAYLEDGTVMHVNTVSLPCTTSLLQCGYHSFPNAVMVAVQTTDIDLPMLGENNNPPDKYEFNYTAGGKSFHCTVSARDTANYFHHDDWGSSIHEKICDFTVNGVKGYGITEFVYRNKAECPVPAQKSVLLLEEPFINRADEQSLTLPFTKAACCSSRLVGGKGCQLAFLTQMDSKKKYIVPQGFCLTIAAFELQLTRNPVLAEQVSLLEQVCSKRTEGQIQDICKEVVDAFKSTPLHSDIQQIIAGDLIRIFHSEHDDKLFAVRSSAAGEDSAEMSAAGQMETILGVKGLQSVFQAVAQCWSSHFAFPAVEYRRQHGQPIKSSMGVVIQEMVKAQCAGVLFTRDPLTGNPRKMVANANYGLGESVVSGGSEPDNITITRDWDDTLKIGEQIIGSKKVKIQTLEDGGTREEMISSEDSKSCCIKEQHMLRLAEIGIQLEKEFGDPRDIEFAVSDDVIYLLQARPITSLENESEWELIHEFDSGIASDSELFTTANIQEMMPGAVTPLTYSTFVRSIERAGQEMYVQAGVVSRYKEELFKFLSVTGNCIFINLHYMMALYEKKVATTKKKMAELAVLGETLDDFKEEELHAYHGIDPHYKRIIRAIKHWRNMSNAFKRAKAWEERLKDYSIADRSHSTAEELYGHITEQIPHYDQCWTVTFHNSASSGSWGTVLLAVVSQGKEVWTTEYYSDVAMMLSNCTDVYSADVPSALQTLAKIIANSDKRVELISKTPEEAVEWLKSEESGLAGKKFADFMKAHGHRCVREGEFRVKSWQTEPVKVVEVIQAMLKAPQTPGSSSNKSKLSVKDAIRNVQSPTTWFGRQILKKVLPKARQAVGRREWGKSLSIQMVEVFKLAYWKLAKMMVNEGRIPDEDLLFFFTHQEIGKLLADRSGRLVAKAQKRRRLLPKQNSFIYERINRGIPKPVEESIDEEDYVITSLKLKGMPVSCGVVRGTARVVTSLAEASSIQQGDILIVHYTDVGWSPYFPLISGLVTEIGGLLSHGAVVAREYGLPCVVNMRKATSMFQSGDQVLLNGTKGTLEKLEE